MYGTHVRRLYSGEKKADWSETLETKEQFTQLNCKFVKLYFWLRNPKLGGEEAGY